MHRLRPLGLVVPRPQGLQDGRGAPDSGVKFDEQGNRVAVRPASGAGSRESVYFFEQEKVDDWGFCDEEIPCDNVTHLCSRFKGHGGRCAAVHVEQVAGRRLRRIEQA